MHYPKLKAIPSRTLWTEQFTGLDRRPRTYDGAFDAMGNMTGESWPLLCSRKKRGIVACVLLSIFTFGIYYLYWMASLADDLNAGVKSRNGTDTGGIAVVLLSIITCGIYGLYWMYKAGEKCDWLCGEQNGYRHILYLVIGLFGFGIVSLALMQDTLNVRLHG